MQGCRTMQVGIWGARSADGKDQKCTHVLGGKSGGKRALVRHWRKWVTILKVFKNIIIWYILDYFGFQHKPLASYCKPSIILLMMMMMIIIIIIICCCYIINNTYLLNYLLTYLLTPWSTVLLEKLNGFAARSQEIPRIYGTRKFITIHTSTRQLSLSWARSIQSAQPLPFPEDPS
jgi:hypothetical protein